MSATKRTGCIFCGTSPTTNAHIFRKGWVAQLAPTARTFRHEQVRHEPGREFERSWSADVSDFKVKAACARCNGGWMERLDLDAESAFTTAAAMGYSVKVAAMRDRGTVARWCLLVAVLFDQAQASPRVGMDAHRALYAGRIPEGVMVWLTRLERVPEAPLVFARAKDLSFDEPVEKDVGTEDHVPDAYFITFGIGHLAVQVLVPVPRPGGISERPQVRRFANWALVRQLYPDTLTPLIWPPPQTLPWEWVEEFTGSFQTIERPAKP